MKTWEFKRKAQKFLRIIRNYSLKSSRTILAFIRRHPIALFALFISIMGSAPITSRFLIYYLYEPKVGVHLGSYEDDFAGRTTFNFSDIWGVNIENYDVDRDIKMYIEFVTSESVILHPHPGEPLEKDWEKSSSSYLEHYLVSPDDLDTYCKLARIYGYQEQFATPSVFYLFDYILKMSEEGKEVKLTIIDAKPNVSFLKSLSDRYYRENHVIVNFVDDGFKPNLVDHGSVVHEMTSRGSLYFRESLKNFSTKMSIKEITEWILNRRHNNDLNLKIGTIINKPKDSKWLSKEEYNRILNNKMRLFIPERFKNVTIRTRYNVRGMNSLEKCDVLFIYGTPVISKYQIEKQFVFWKGYKPATLETVEKEPHGDRYHYVDKELETFRRLREEDEGYHEIHRIRLFLVKKDVYVFGKVPKSIEEEGIRVEKINKNYITNFERNKWIEEFVQQRSPVPAIVVEEEMVKQFDEIKSQRWAYQIVLKSVKENKHLTMRNRGIFYEDKK